MINDGEEFKWARVPKFSGKIESSIKKVDELLNQSPPLALAVTMGDESQMNFEETHANLASMEKINEALDRLAQSVNRIKDIQDAAGSSSSD
eukprot:9473447-Pyramimonas_sp.AAC.1